MEVNQIYSLVNSVTGEILGKTDILKEDLSNVVDMGKELFSATDVDNYVKSLVNRVGKTVFTKQFICNPKFGKIALAPYFYNYPRENSLSDIAYNCYQNQKQVIALACTRNYYKYL